MVKKVTGLLFVLALVFSLTAAGFAKGGKETRVEGSVVRTGKGTITVHVRDVGTERVVHYDDSTRFGSQYHGDKKVTPITAADIKEGDQVICLGAYNDKGEFHATDVSKRLSHSPAK